MTDFSYQKMLPLKKDTSKYRLLTRAHVSTTLFEGQQILKIEPNGLEILCEEAFKDVSHLLRSTHLSQLSKIFDDENASANDRLVTMELLKNAVISAKGEFPLCQDTGTAIIFGKKGQQVWTGFDEKEVLSKGVYLAFKNNNLRYSQNAALDMYTEKNTMTNLPAQIDLEATTGSEYHFLFVAKGGGCANKTFLYQETKAILNPESLMTFFREKMITIGSSACPPYHLVFVIGGTSAEYNLKTVKLASTGYLDSLPTEGSETGRGFRDITLEKKVLGMSRNIGIGAQFGGRYFCLDVRVIRLPRHGASCPVGMGVSCSADRQIKGKITKDGIFLEELERNPGQFIPGVAPQDSTNAIQVDLNQPMNDILKKLSTFSVSTALRLNGKIIVARDIAHAKFKERLDNGRGLPDYLKNHIIYYAGPAKTPEGFPSGSFGPTTAGRMDSYVPLFQEHGASLIMLAKGNRERPVTESCQKNGGFYLGSVGGPAARLGKECIKKVDLIEYPELGMEAVYAIDVVNFPAFIIIDDKGNNFYDNLLPDLSSDYSY